MAVSRVLKRSATYDDLLRVAPPLVAEILDGDLYTSPRPAPRHTRARSSLGGMLLPPFDMGRGGPGGWIILCASRARPRLAREPDRAHARGLSARRGLLGARGDPRGRRPRARRAL